VAVSTRDLPTLLASAREQRAESGRGRPAVSRTLHPRPALDTPFVAPRNAVEERLATLWRELLGLDEIGVEDDFFELGGDSLLATQVLARLRKEGTSEITLALFLEQPTVAAQAALLAPGEESATPQEGGSRGALEDILAELEAMPEPEEEA
jgi:aryl carrier-like protein